MKKFSEKIVEQMDSFDIISKEIKDYTTKMSKKLPIEVQNILYILNKYGIESREEIDEIKSGRKSSIDRISGEHSISLDELDNLKKQLRDLKTKIRLLPQYQTKSEREMFIQGQLAMNDLTMDLDSAKGRESIAKQYSPIVFKLVQQFNGKSPLDKSELLSAGMEGLTYAMNTFRKSDTKDLDDLGKKAKALSFKSYVAWCVRNKILTDINNNSHTVKLGQYHYSKLKDTEGGIPSFMSIDKTRDNEDFDVDYFADLSTDGSSRRGEDREWDKIIKIISNKFPQRDVTVFLKSFGLGNYEQMKGKDIAKEFKITPPMITVIVKNIINFLKTDRTTKDILSDIADMYNESLVVQLFQLDKQVIRESLLNDDIYLLFEELNRWADKDAYMMAINTTLNKFSIKEARFIYDCLIKGFDYLDSNYKKNKQLIVWFLSELYPTENITKMSDVNILELMNELIEATEKHNIKW
jgi:RNA polymerase sigma factor (sigma-70 family)